jgi:hypothetical protein
MVEALIGSNPGTSRETVVAGARRSRRFAVPRVKIQGFVLVVRAMKRPEGRAPERI